MSSLTSRDLYLVWPGPHSQYLINRLYDFIGNYYPEATNAFQIARNFEEDIRSLLRQNQAMTEIDNQIYYIGNISELLIKFLIRSGDEEIFPNLIMNSYGLEDPSDEAATTLFDIIVDTIEYHLKRELLINIDEQWDQRTYQLRISEKKITLMKNFEKNQLGIFLYLLYLRDLFKDNDDVCVIISDLSPLIKQVQRIEQELGTISKKEFIEKHQNYATDYDEIFDSYSNEPISLFRFYLLYLILTYSGPYLQVYRNEQTDPTVETRVSRSFSTLMNRCQKSGARYTVSFLIMKDYDEAHANIIIIDHDIKTIERYEPNGFLGQPTLGSTGRGIFQDIADKADDSLDQLAKKLGYKYHPPAYFCPKLGVQQIEKYFLGSIGYCVTWSILYGIERLESGLHREDITNNFLDILVKRYGLEGLTEEDKAKSLEQLIIQKIQSIFEDMDEIYTELSDALGIKIRYEQGKLVYFS